MVDAYRREGGLEIGSRRLIELGPRTKNGGEMTREDDAWVRRW
jgi:hypothetical protein